MDYLTSGYVRLNCESPCIQTPTELLQLISDNIGNIFLRFSSSLLLPEHMKLINDKKVTLIKPGGGFGHGASALIDFPISNCSKSKFTWNIRLHGRNGLRNYHYFIGVAANNHKNFDCSAHAGLENAYGILGGLNGVALGGHSSTDLKCCNNEFGNDDVVCIDYDGEKRQMTFSNLKTNKQIHSMPLPADLDVTHWYPAISLRDPGDTAEIIN